MLRKTSDPNTSERVLNVTYNASKSPIQIEETNVDKVSFSYNDNNQRSIMYYGGFQTDKLARPLRKYYSMDGSMEVKENGSTNTFEFITYVGGDGYSAPVAVKSDGTGTTQNYLYLHRDYQGSIIAVTDASANIVEKRLFDAWGNIIKVQDGAGNTLNGLTVLDRGYTGHEHIQSVGLINMNARLYDPILHRFLQTDNVIQDVTNTQNYNSYGYVYNNPLSNTDITGNSCDCPGGSIGIGPGTETGSSWDFKQFDKDYRISEWWKRNINGDKWSDAIKSGGNFISNNIKSFGNDISNGFKSLFGHKSDGPPANKSTWIKVSDWFSVNTDYFADTQTRQIGKKATFNSGVGDQLKLKTYMGVKLRLGSGEMFEINDTFFNGKNEGRNYQLNLGQHSLNFRPKDYRIRYMAPSGKNTSRGMSIGTDGVGWHYNIRNGNGRSAGYDVAFRLGGYTVMLVSGVILSIFQPEAAPLIESAAEEIIAYSYQLAF